MLELVKKLINEKDWLGAIQAIEPHMEKYPNDALGLFCFGQIMLETDKQSIAYPIYKLGIQLEPKRPEMWINMGKAAGELHFYDEEKKCFLKALQLAKAQKNDLAKSIATQNLGTNAVHLCNPDSGLHWAKESLKIEETRQAHIDLGFSRLMKRDFGGWADYNYGLDFQKHRDIRQYNNEPEWDGSPDQRVIIYGEQGLGDQIIFAGAVKDARRISKSVSLHVNPKLVNLFSRSFVLDTHGYGPDENLDWASGYDASASMSRIQEYFRDDISKFNGNPYLIADPFRRIQWDASLSSLGDKMKVGIAWTGGAQLTQREARSTALETLLPLLKTDVTWISLEYKDRTDEIEAFEKNHGIKIHDFSWATRTGDYDDTAALVAELDLIISVPTSIVHLAGALGVPCWCILHPFPHFMFGLEGDSMPFYNSVKLFRRKHDFTPVIATIGEKLNEMRHSDTRRARTRRDTQSSNRIGTDSHFRQRAIFHNQHPNSG